MDEEQKIIPIKMENNSNNSDSTTMTVETIVPNPNEQINLQDHQNSLKRNINQSKSTNHRKNSLTNSQTSMVSSTIDNKSSHLYTTADQVAPSNDIEGGGAGGGKLKGKKELNKTSTNTLDTKNNKNTDQNNKQQITSSTSSLTLIPPPPTIKRKYPIIIWLGTLQLILSIILAALGGLLIARGASLAICGSGLWSGAFAGVAGSLGVMGNIRKAQTGFLAINLICVASSTLAIALTGIGVVRDSNLAHQDETILGAVAGGSGLLFALAIHFLVSVFSVYYSALRLCSRDSQSQVLENSDISTLAQKKVEDYIKSIAPDHQNINGMMYQNMIQHHIMSNYNNEKPGSTTNSGEKLIALWLGNANQPIPVNLPRPIMLVPAGSGLPMPPMYPPPPPTHHHHQLMYAPSMISSGIMGPPKSGSPPQPLPYMMPPNIHEMEHFHRKCSSHSLGEKGSNVDGDHRSKRHSRGAGGGSSGGGGGGGGRGNSSRKSNKEARREERRAFTYTGLDRAIADSFLEHQEKCNNSNCGSSCRGGDSSSLDRIRKFNDVAM